MGAVGAAAALVLAALAAVPSSGAGAEPSSGYWIVTASGEVIAFGDAPVVDSVGASGSVTDVESSPDGGGVWVLDADGSVQALGSAFGGASIGALPSGEIAEGISSTPSGAGYWVFTSLGRVFPVGDAAHLGDLAGVSLNAPVVDAVATPSGLGYYMVASDGGIFSFGDAEFTGSMGGVELNAPVVGLAPDPDGSGYWLVAADGGIFAFGAEFLGSMGGTPINQPVAGAVAHGNGYLMVAADGGVFNFSDLPFEGSLGNNPPAEPVVAITPFPVDATPPATTDAPQVTAVDPRAVIDVQAPTASARIISFSDDGGGAPDLEAHLYQHDGKVVIVFGGWSTVSEPLCIESSWEGLRASESEFGYTETDPLTCDATTDVTVGLVDCGNWAYAVTPAPASVIGELYVAVYDATFDYYAFPDDDFVLGGATLRPFTPGARNYVLPPGILPTGTAGTC